MGQNRERHTQAEGTMYMMKHYSHFKDEEDKLKGK